MNNTISWIAAAAENGEVAPHPSLPEEPARRDSLGLEKLPSHNFPTHQFPSTSVTAQSPVEELEPDEVPTEESCPDELCEEDTGRAVGRPQVETALDRNPDIWAYRKRTTALLRRYLRYSLETGRVPSLLGREFFRATVTAYTVATFEERVLFAYDVERCLQRLDEFSRQVLARIVLQEHGHEEAARLLHCSRKRIERTIPEALDDLSEIFLEVRILTRLVSSSSAEDEQR
jgi:DNA-directed RNA polymerase specialized sigma24 family protein